MKKFMTVYVVLGLVIGGLTTVGQSDSEIVPFGGPPINISPN